MGGRVIEVGPQAALGGATALRAAGVTGVNDVRIHVSSPKSTRPGHPSDVVVHESRRWDTTDVLAKDPPRMAPAVAAVQAALWARSDRQAALYLCLPVQQRLVPPTDLVETVQRVRRDRRRRLMRRVAADLCQGAQSLGELDFADLGRRRGWPEPSRQRVAQGPRGRIYLDVAWERHGVVVEVDGIGHLRADEWLADALRQNSVMLDGARVLRVPVLALRVDPEPFLRQVDAALRAGGWRSPSPLRPRNRG